jgi:hypothetical protein
VQTADCGCVREELLFRAVAVASADRVLHCLVTDKVHYQQQRFPVLAPKTRRRRGTAKDRQRGPLRLEPHLRLAIEEALDDEALTGSGRDHDDVASQVRREHAFYPEGGSSASTSPSARAADARICSWSTFIV